MVAAAEPVCIDWYLSTYYYDDFGNIVSYTEVYMYTICYEGGSGGGGMGPVVPEDPEEFDWGMPADQDYSENRVPQENENGEKIEKRWYKWTFHRAWNELFWCKSYESGVCKKVGSAPWIFTDFKHLTQDPIGATPGREISIVLLDSDVSFSNYKAKVKLWYKLHRIGSGFGTTIPYYSGDFQSHHDFKTDDNVEEE